MDSPEIARCSRCMDTRLKHEDEETVSHKRGLVDKITLKWVKCERCNRGYMRLVHLYTTPALIKSSLEQSAAETKRLNRSYGGMRGWQTRLDKAEDMRWYGERLRIGFNYLNGIAV